MNTDQRDPLTGAQLRDISPYPFEEGDDYWTIESNKVVHSCWDDLSEDYHDKNPKTQYFTTEAHAVSALSRILKDKIAEIENYNIDTQENESRYITEIASLKNLLDSVSQT